MATPISTADYLRWVKASINLKCGSSLRDNGTDTPEYRTWVKVFQKEIHLPVTGNVDKPTQDKLIWHNHANPRFVVWACKALASYMIPHGFSSFVWHPNISKAVREFESSKALPVDGGWIGPIVETTLRLYSKMPGSGVAAGGRPGVIP